MLPRYAVAGGGCLQRALLPAVGRADLADASPEAQVKASGLILSAGLA